MKVALELQPCCGNRSGIGAYTYELTKRLRNQSDLEFYGNIFNFAGKNDNSQALQGITIPIHENRLFPYGIYRRIWDIAPISYNRLFPDQTDLTIFFNFIIPPRISGIQYSIERSNRILTISAFSKGEIAELLGVPREKISVIYPAPSLHPEIADFGECCQKWDIRRPYLLYVGTIEPRKNLARLLRAFALSKEMYHIPHHLVLAGGRGWRDEEILQTVKEISCKEDVIFTGYVSAVEKNTLYQNAAAFLFPSLYEGFGIPPLEAMSFGCPVICANAASLLEVVGDAAELVDPLEVEGIASGIWRVLSDEIYVRNLVEKGRLQAKKYTWDASANRLMEICREIGK